eukprot:1137712-Prorocentrum_minimum.AAC.1
MRLSAAAAAPVKTRLLLRAAFTGVRVAVFTTFTGVTATALTTAAPGPPKRAPATSAPHQRHVSPPARRRPVDPGEGFCKLPGSFAYTSAGELREAGAHFSAHL